MAALVLGIAAGTVKAHAEDPVTPIPSPAPATAAAVTVKDIDYENLTMKIYKHGNAIVYFAPTIPSKMSDWDEVTGVEYNAEGYVLMDISWATATAVNSFYLRGDINNTAVQITLPKQSTAFKVKFDKASGGFTFDGKGDSEYFFYRKSSDYNWTKVFFDQSDPSYEKFLEKVASLRFKGAKLIFKLGQEIGCADGSTDDFGARPSKEVAVTISKLSTAPSIKLNVTKLTFNTKATMEYSEDLTEWKPCTKNMKLEELADAALCAGATPGKAVTLYFRTAQTEKKPASQVAAVTIPGQTKAPTTGTTDAVDVRYGFSGKYMIINFLTASTTRPFEYCIVKDGAEFDEHTAKWRTVKGQKDIKLSQKSVEDAEIYVRVKGVSANAAKGIEMALPSDYDSFTASGFDEPLN